MKILFCVPSYPDNDSIYHLQQLLKEHQLLVCTKEEVLENIEDVDVLVPWGYPVNEKLIQKGHFKFIQQPGVGLEKIDIAAATRNGIWVARAPSTKTGNAESVAEHALMLMLMLSRKFPKSQQTLKNKKIGTPTGEALLGKKACIIGLGGIGKVLAKYLSDLKMKVTGVHEYPERGAPPGISNLYALSDIHSAVKEADYAILCLNYMSSRHHLIDRSELQAMKKGAFLINIARGGLLNQEALLQELRKGHLAGAGLDVFWEEPVDTNHPLFRENVIATPHVAGVTDVSLAGNLKLVAENIQRYARGETPLYVVNHPGKKD